MIFLMTAWSLLLIFSFWIGAALLEISKETVFKRIGDRFVISVWLGIIVIANMLLAISLFSRLTILILSLLLVSLVLFSIVLNRGNQIKCLVVFFSPGMMAGWVALLAGISFVATQIVVWFDTGGYHFGLIKWLSHYGAVPGLALIYYGFGYTSSWFALASPFNDWLLDGRAGAVTGGFAFLMMILHFWIAINRIVSLRGKFEDWFLAVSSLLAMAVITRYEIYVSPSTDLPVIILTIVTAWTILIISRARALGASETGSGKEDSGVIPLIFAAGAFSIKASALPLLAVATAFYLLLRKISLGRAMRVVAIVLIILLPFFAVQTVTSGCLLYPSSWLCLDLPWVVGADKIKAVSEQIVKAAQWDTITPPGGASWRWLLQWPRREVFQAALILLGLLSFALSFKKLRGGALRWAKWPVGVGISGFLYTLILGPTWRYSLGYLSIIAGLFISLNCHERFVAWQKGHLGLRKIFSSAAISVFILFALAVTIPSLSLMVNNLSAFNSLRPRLHEAVRKGDITADLYDQPRILLPPKIVNFWLRTDNPQKFVFSVFDLELAQIRVNDIHLYKPKNGYQCWDAPLPCSQMLTYEGIRLRDPTRGIGGGFARTPESISGAPATGRSAGSGENVDVFGQSEIRSD